MIRTYPELPPDITMEQFLRHIPNPSRWITNFSYGYVPSIFAHDSETLRVSILEIRAAKLANLKGLTSRGQCDMVTDSHIIEIKTNDNNPEK